MSTHRSQELPKNQLLFLRFLENSSLHHILRTTYQPLLELLVVHFLLLR